MTKAYKGIWHKAKVLCPKCLVQPGDISNYGTDQQGFWFNAFCPHCSSVVKWYRRIDLSPPEVSEAVGEQMSLFNEQGKNSSHEKKRKRNKKNKSYIF